MCKLTHCPEWEDLFKRRPDACVESADYRRKVEKWLTTLEEIRKRGIQVTTKIFPEGAHRVLLPLDDPMREKALNYICHKLDRGEKITAPDLKKSIAVFEGQAAATSCPVRKNNTNVLPSSPDHDVKPIEAPLVTLGDKLQKEQHVAQTEQPATEQDPGTPSEITWSPLTCTLGKCPDDQNHLVKGKELGDKCGIAGSFLRDVKFCPILEKRKRISATGFTPASIPVTDGLGNRIIRGPPIKITKTPKTPAELEKIVEDFLDYIIDKPEADEFLKYAENDFNGDLPQASREVFIRVFGSQ